MKKSNPIHYQLLEFLADGNCHSGEILGKKLGISRTAIWKHIHQLINLGAPIQQITQRGYQLQSPLTLLNSQKIQSLLTHRHVTFPYQIHCLTEIDSTNRFLNELPANGHTTFCCAEKQTAGRGRFRRQWSSPFGENIYFSGRWELTICPSKLAGLSLVVGLAILETLQQHQLHQDVLIKWPNDLLWHHKKLCGILIELSGESHGTVNVVIGIGLNVNTSSATQSLSDKPWCSLFDITGKYLDRNILIADLIVNLNHTVTEFINAGFSHFKSRWEKVNYLNNQWITISQPTGKLNGYAIGVSAQGLLCVKDNNDVLHYVSSGDASLSAESM